MKETMKIIENFLTTEVLYNIDRNNIAPEENLLKSGVIDSMAIIKLVAFIEERFKIHIDEEDLVPENFENLGSITEYVNHRIESL